MGTTTVQSRFDARAQQALKRLVRNNGWTTSQALRECVLRVDEQTATPARPRLIGIGCIDSGITDLATNEAHMKDYGVSSMGKGWQRPQERIRKRKDRVK
jgi:hypothetical protein